MAGEEIPAAGAEEPILLLDPHGSLQPVLPGEVNQAVSQGGYSIPKPEMVNQYQEKASYETLPQEIGTALEGAGVGTTFGLSSGLESQLSKLGGPLQNLAPEEQLKRAKYNPGLHGLSEAAGLAGSTLIPGLGEANLLTHAGEGVAGALGLGAEGAGLASRIGSRAVSDAVQFAGVQSGDEISKAILDPNQDPGTAVQSALTNIGLAGVFGGALGAGFGTISPLWEASSKTKIGQIFSAIRDKLGGVEGGIPDAASEAIANSKINLDPVIRPLVEQNSLAKDLFQDLRQAPDRYGQEAKDKLISAYKDIGNAAAEAAGKSPEQLEALDNLSAYETGTNLKSALVDQYQNTARKALMDEQELENFKTQAPEKALEALGKTSEDLKDIGSQSLNERGTVLRNSLGSAIDDVIKPTSELLDSVQKEFKNTPLDPTDISDIQKRIQRFSDSEGYEKASFSKERGLVKQILDDLPKQETVEDLRRLGSNIYNNTKEPGLQGFGKQIYKIFKEAQVGRISREIAGKDSDLLERYTLANSQYSQFKDLLERMNDRLHVGRFKGAGTFIDALLDMNPETVLSRLGKTNDADLLQLLNKEFPEIASQVRDYHVDQLLKSAKTNAPKGAAIDLDTIHSGLDKMTKEMKSFLFPEGTPEVISRLKNTLEMPPSESVRLSMDLAEQLNAKLKLGKIDSPIDFLDKLQKIEPESLLKKLKDPSSVSLLDNLQQSFPEAAKIIRSHQIDELLKSAGGSKLDATKFFKSVNTLSPELRNSLFSAEALSQLKALEGMSRVLKEIPDNYSNTSGFLSRLQKHLLGGVGALIGSLVAGGPHGAAAGLIIGELAQHFTTSSPNAIKLALLKFLGSSNPIEAGGFKTTVDFIDHAMKGNNLLLKSSKNIFKAGAEVLPQSVLPTQKERDRLDQHLKKLQDNPQLLQNIGGKLGHYLPNQATALAQTSTNALNYLNAFRPNPAKQSPLDSIPKSSAFQKSAYAEALNIAEQPLSILPKIKNGLITSTEIKHFASLYPSLYKQTAQKITNEMMDAVNKGESIPYRTRIGLSLFLGQPLDSTMTPQAIQMNQAALQAPPTPSQQQQGMPEGRRGQRHSSTALNKLIGQDQTPLQARQSQRLRN